MRKSRIIGAALGLLGIGAGIGAVIAQSISVPRVQSLGPTDIMQVVPGAAPSAQSVYASLLQLQAYLLGGNSQRTSVTAPALTSCGTGSPSILGDDVAGTVTMGTSATGCVITFNTAYGTAPHCVVTSRTAYGTTALAYTVSTAAITTTQSSGSSNLIDYFCKAPIGAAG